MKENNILSECQYGFRDNRSTSLWLTDLIEQLADKLDAKLTTIGIFIDLKKAFDSVDHNKLSQILNHYGIRGKANEWLSSYLKNRKQYVFIIAPPQV